MAFGIRGLVAAAAATAVLLLGALVAPIATAAPAAPTAPVAPTAPRWAAASSAPIQPGVTTTTQGGGTCTANFVFTAAGGTYLGQAAHCAGTGESTETDGCTSGTRPLGTDVVIHGTDGVDRHGVLAYSSWVTMQTTGERDPDTCAYNDFALVAVAPSDVAEVNPSLPFFGGPAGLDTDGLTTGEQVFGYGNSPLRLDFALLSPKVGVAASDVGGGRGHVVYTVSPAVPGDSGSGFVDADGRAIGLVSTLNLAPLPVSNGLADLSRALDYASTLGGLGRIALVPGTEPFDPAPAELSDTDLSSPAGPPVAG